MPCWTSFPISRGFAFDAVEKLSSANWANFGQALIWLVPHSGMAFSGHSTATRVVPRD
jgi:hypothetical protein